MAEQNGAAGAEQAVAKRIREAAERALAEARLRRENAAASAVPPREVGGADGPEPVRYGDWDVKGRAVDF